MKISGALTFETLSVTPPAPPAGKERVYVTTDGRVMVQGPDGIVGQVWPPLPLVNETGVRTVMQTSTQATTATTFANLTQLGFSVEANRLYAVEWRLIYTAAATTTGLGAGFSIPGSSRFAGRIGIDMTTTSRMQTGTTAAATTMIAPTSSAGTAMAAELQCSFLSTSAGIVYPTFASEVSGSTVTVQIGSSGLAYAKY